jgi:hypothetical protein
MRTNTLRRLKLTADALGSPETSTAWLWHGYLHDGEITLLTSQWKTGKTTLVAGLLRQLGRGGEFLGQSLRAAKAWIVSEESAALWGSRLARNPIGEHVELLARPFRGKPSLEDWQSLLDDALEARWKGELDLLIVDPLAAFLPGRSESDPAAILAMLQPMREICSEGCSVLVLHHPRKKPSEPGASARGTGALLGYVDHVLELSRVGRLKSDNGQRTILAQSRRPETPDRLTYEWTPATGVFQVVTDPLARQYEANWLLLEKILKTRETAATHLELLTDWPPDQPKPSASSFYDWLNRAHAEKRVRREGKGTSKNPWRYRLPNEDDKYYDRGELPPLRDLPRLR